MKFFSVLFFILISVNKLFAQSYILKHNYVVKHNYIVNHKFEFINHCDTSVLEMQDVGHLDYLFPKPNALEPSQYFVRQCNSSIPVMFFTIGEDKQLADYVIWFYVGRHNKIKGVEFMIVNENKNCRSHYIYDYHFFPFAHIEFLKALNKLYRHANRNKGK